MKKGRRKTGHNGGLFLLGRDWGGRRGSVEGVAGVGCGCECGCGVCLFVGSGFGEEGFGVCGICPGVLGSVGSALALPSDLALGLDFDLESGPGWSSSLRKTKRDRRRVNAANRAVRKNIPQSRRSVQYNVKRQITTSRQPCSTFSVYR